jgi:hypothetical protein
MNAILRATATAAFLFMAWPTPAPLHAEPCRIGPVAFEAPTCTVEEGSEAAGPARSVQWKEGGKYYTVLVIAQKKRYSFRGYVARWRRIRGCTAHEIPVRHAIRFEGAPPEDKRSTPPQVTWAGGCMAPEWFINHAIGLKRVVVELRVTHVLTSGDPVPLETALAAFLERVHLYPED